MKADIHRNKWILWKTINKQEKYKKKDKIMGRKQGNIGKL
jgi:hypothetical protein